MTVIEGGDAALAAAVDDAGSVVRFVPDASSDLARALGLVAGAGVQTSMAIDALRLDTGEHAVNMIVLGPPPDRLGWLHRMRECVVMVEDREVWRGSASTVLIANGEYLRGRDVVPRGHPADGRFEVHVYAVPADQRAEMRRRLKTGTHVPHPAIRTFHATEARVIWSRSVRLEIDGRRRAPVSEVLVTLLAGAVRLEGSAGR